MVKNDRQYPPGGHICSDENLKDAGFELGQGCKALLLLERVEREKGERQSEQGNVGSGWAKCPGGWGGRDPCLLVDPF